MACHATLPSPIEFQTAAPFVQLHAAAVALQGRQAVTLTTQCSLDRWPKVEQQAAAWGGPAAIAVYIPAPRGSPAADQGIRLMRERADTFAAHHPHQPLTLSLLFAMHNAREGASAITVPAHRVTPDNQLTYDQLYPINALRKLAVQSASSHLVLFADGDFIPSEGLAGALSGPSGELAAAAGQVLAAAERGERLMLVLPSFELALDSPVADDSPGGLAGVPRDRGALRAHPAARPFDCGVFAQPPAARSLDYEAWWQAEEACAAPYRPLWEPLGLVDRRVAPPFDERFRGYGLNKQQWALHLAALGCGFLVAPRHFLVTLPHARAGTWRPRPGTAADGAQLERVRRLYAAFERELASQGLAVQRAACRVGAGSQPGRAQGGAGEGGTLQA